MRGEGRVSTVAVADEAARRIEIGERAPDEGVDLREGQSLAQELDEALVRADDALGRARGAFDVLGLRDEDA